MGRGDVSIGGVPSGTLVSIRDPGSRNGTPRYVEGGPGSNSGGAGPIVVNAKATRALGTQATRKLTLPAQDTPKSVLYGHVQTGGNVVFWKFYNGQLYICYGIAGHEIHAYTKIMLGDYQLQLPSSGGPSIGGDGTFGHSSFRFVASAGLDAGTFRLYKGTAAQTEDLVLHSLDSRWIYAYNGTETDAFGKSIGPLAYFWVALKAPTDSQTPNPDPMRMTAEVDGALLLDHRADPTLATRYFTKNSALICADAKLRFQLNGDTSQIDWASIDESADVCDQTLSDSTKRYEMSIALRQPTSYQQLEDSLRQHCMGVWVRNSGKWRFYIDRAQSYSGFSFSDGSDGNPCNIRDGVQLGIVTKPSDSIATQVEVQHVDPADGFKQKSVFEPENGDPSRRKTYNLPGLSGSAIAIRVATQIFNRGRLDKMVSLPVNEEGTQILPGMVIKATIAGALSAQQLLVADVSRVGGQQLGWNLDCLWYDSAAYSNSIATRDTTSSNALPDASDSPPAPTDLILTAQAGGGVLVAWTAPSWPFLTGFRVTVDLGSGEQLVAVTAAADAQVLYPNPTGATNMTFFVYAVAGTFQSLPLSDSITNGSSTGGDVLNIQDFDANGTFVVPAGVTKVWIDGGGGGGGGGGNNSQTNGAAGGGAGAECKDKSVSGLTPGASVAVTIGAPGAAGAATPGAGGAGGTTSFGAFVSLPGGNGGAAGSGSGSTTPGAGGDANAASGQSGDTTRGGMGGASSRGGGGGNPGGTGTGKNGAWSAGGSGAAAGKTTTGGPGGAGWLRVKW